MIENTNETLLVDETLYSTKLTNKFKNRKEWTPQDNRQIKAFLPGTVTEILVKTGDQVIEGQTVIKYEAMKMINNVQALTSGVVKEIFVSAGDKFPKGFVLVELQ